MRALVLAKDDDERAFRRNHGKVGMRHTVAFAASHLDLVWPERTRMFELAYGLNDHEKPIVAAVEFIKPTPAGRRRRRRPRRTGAESLSPCDFPKPPAPSGDLSMPVLARGHPDEAWFCFQHGRFSHFPTFNP